MPQPPPKQLSGAPERLISRRSTPQLRLRPQPHLDPARLLLRFLPFVQSGRTFHRCVIIIIIICHNSVNDNNNNVISISQLQPPPKFSRYLCYQRCHANAKPRGGRYHGNGHHDNNNDDDIIIIVVSTRQSCRGNKSGKGGSRKP